MSDPNQQKINDIIVKYGLHPDWIYVKHGVRFIKKIGIDKLAIGIGSPIDMQLAHISDHAVVIKATVVVNTVKFTVFGEVSPQNNKFPYPVAVAEKRARSRVLLSALGLHGFLFGEDEIDFVVQANKLLDARAKAAKDSEDNLLNKIKEKKK